MPGLQIRHEAEPLWPPVPVILSSRIMSSPKSSAVSLAMMSNSIKYIPPQMDRLAGTSTQASRENPIRLMVRDAGVLVGMLRYLPYLFLPFQTRNRHAELYPSPKGIRDMVLQSWLFCVELMLLLFVPVAYMVLPGFLILFGAAAACLVIYSVSWPMQGPRMVYSEMDEATVKAAKEHENERWLFINGCMVGQRGLQQNINRIAQTFGRPVIGIHNQTYGLIADLMECMIQRSFGFNTMDVQVAYDYVKACLLDPTVTRIVLIAHSQGGIIASMVIDGLFADLPAGVMSKLEVYTFGNAASHFNNPRVTGKSQAFDTSAAADCCIGHIEHYVNEKDMVPRWGVLYNVIQILDNRFSGRIFVRMGASGHMFNQHYLDAMFPLDQALAGNFLDQVVDVDEKLALRRESKAVQQVSVMRRESMKQLPNGEALDWGDRDRIPVDLIVNGEASSASENLLINFVDSQTGSDARGKTVRQLSRLWKYVNGGIPAD